MSTTTEIIKKLSLPCVPTRQLVAFPGIPLSLEVGRAFSKRACDAALKNDSLLFVVCQNEYTEAEPTIDQVYPVGVTVKIKQLVKSPGGVFRIIAEPQRRAYLNSFSSGKYITAEVMEKTVSVADNGGVKGEALMRDVKNTLGEFVKFLPKFSKELWFIMNSIQDPGMFCDFIASNIVVEIEDKQKLLEEFDPIRRLELMLLILENEKQILSEEDKIHKKVRDLSGGTARRVEIVRAVLSPSDVLIMDEPLTGLDDYNAERAVSYIRDNIGERVFIASSHNKRLCMEHSLILH